MKRSLKILMVLLTISLVVGAGCLPTPTPSVQVPTPTAEATATQIEPTTISTGPQPDWWKTAVFYEIFVRSFKDSNGDGIGDFNGITMMLDYLNDGDPATETDLGITALWLMPINPSPSYHGYDVKDYTAVNPEYGTLQDFENLLKEAHKRGINIIIDFVINHTSSQHPWFLAAKDPASPYRDYYVWSETNPGFAGPWGQNVWIPSGKAYYYALFWDQMPDLNFRNPAVTQEIYNASRFWLEDVGVDGFRVDAARHLVEDGQTQMNTPETHDWFKGWRTYYKSVQPNAMSVGEIWDSTSSVAKYLQGDELDLAFNFDLADAWISDLSGGTTSVLKFIYKYEFERSKDTLFATFLTNHDMNRVMSQLNGDEEKAKLAATLLLTFPGVPFIYYGEEIGMSGVKPDEDLRRPMQWSADASAQFTTGNPWRAPYKDYKTVNVSLQDADPNSLLNHYRSLIHLRLDNPALLSGDLFAVDADQSSVLAYLREDGEQTFLIVANFGNQSVSNVSLTLPSSRLTGTLTPRMILGEGVPAGLTVGENGSFSGYVPLAELAQKSAVIVQLR